MKKRLQMAQGKKQGRWRGCEENALQILPIKLKFAQRMP